MRLHIRMAPENEPDMCIFIHQRLQEQNMLQNPGTPDRKRMREMILERLPKNAKWSYTSLRFGLDDIIQQLSKPVNMKDFEKKLDQPMSSQEAAVETLQKSLSIDDILELNSLLKWVYPFEEDMDSLSLQELEAAMVSLVIRATKHPRD